MSDLYWLSDEQMTRLRPYFPKSHSKPRGNDRRVLSGIVFVNRNGLRWCDAPMDYGPHWTLYNRWKSWGEKHLSPDDGRAPHQNHVEPFVNAHRHVQANRT